MVRFKVVGAVLVGSIALASAVACSPKPAPPTDGTTTTVAPTTTTAKSDITTPLDITKFSGDVCSGLTDAQLAPYLAQLDGKDQQSASNGPICTFRPKDPLGPTATVGVQNVATPTQQLLYASMANFPWRENIAAIATYPAVNASAAGSSSHGDCETAAAVNVKQNLYIQFSDTNPSDANYTKPCTVSNALMAELIQNIQGGV